MKALKDLTYQSMTQKRKIRVILCEQQLWMTQLQMSTLFGCSVQEVHAVLKRLFENGELDKRIVNRTIKVQNSAGHHVLGHFYNLDAIIAVGYRLNPKEATYFHIWSMQILKNHLLTDLKRDEYGMIEGLRRKISYLLAVAELRTQTQR
jgi:hypothetical protein